MRAVEQSREKCWGVPQAEYDTPERSWGFPYLEPYLRLTAIVQVSYKCVGNKVLLLAQAACVRHACAMRACVQHAYWLMRLACAMRSLAIVITIIQSFLFSLLAQAACVRHVCLRVPCIAWPLLLPSFSLFLILSVFCIWPTSVKLPCAQICFPQYFGITRR